MVLGRRAPGGAGVVDQDVDVAQALHRLVDHLLAPAPGRWRRRRPSASMPAGLQVAAASSRSAALREVSMILAPASPSASAICRPRPREPPVTGGACPLRSKSFWTRGAHRSVSVGQVVHSVANASPSATPPPPAPPRPAEHAAGRCMAANQPPGPGRPAGRRRSAPRPGLERLVASSEPVGRAWCGRRRSATPGHSSQASIFGSS